MKQTARTHVFRSASVTRTTVNMNGLGQFSLYLSYPTTSLTNSCTFSGKGLGGSSAINFMMWNKPARQYLDSKDTVLPSIDLTIFAFHVVFEELGMHGWNWDAFDKYMKTAEKCVSNRTFSCHPCPPSQMPGSLHQTPTSSSSRTI